MINKKRMLSEFLELTKIRCSTKAEREVGDLLKQRLINLGLDVFEDEVGVQIGGNCGNIIGFLPSNVARAETIMLSAHMDCVEPCGNVSPIVEGGIIKSCGNTILGADDKAGIAAILEGIRAIVENKLPHGGIQVVFTVSEEGGLDGSKNINKKHLKAAMGYALDSGGEPGQIITKAPGQNSIDVIIHGKKAHAGVAPEQGINAIVLAGKALAELKQGRIDEETTANVGIINGGNATNIVPDRVEIKCEARSRNVEKLAAQTEHMRNTFERVALENGGRVEVNIHHAYDPYVLTDDAPVVQLAVKSAESIGLKPVIQATGGGSDANFFNGYGVPTAVLGVGMSKVHTTEEYIKEEDLYNTAELVVAIITNAVSRS
ncbi:M20/M25/M40 family metallo-hydrolase [Dendrosporobacter sp. 1207_IL3150]|uniref:M20/M25/M40 family metallo-hydrolase n=1 Tax=Dendrosporobacter sp. 1207_IL3150 TaxID=3084054 RepID=UPI002FDB0721